MPLVLRSDRQAPRRVPRQRRAVTDPEPHKGHPVPVVTPELQAQADAWLETINAERKRRQAVELVDPVGLMEIAARLGVRPQTARNWRSRGTQELMPEPRWTISGIPVWDWVLDVEPWARATSRLPLQ